MTYIPPKVLESAYSCPHCGAIAKQDWILLNWHGKPINPRSSDMAPVRIGCCQNCNERTIWLNNTLVSPDSGNSPLPNPDMPDDVKQDYMEARAIVNKSPKGAAALLRLALQKLCVHLGGDGRNINADIGHLVENGLPQKMQRALDSVRVIGNNAVHPGHIDLNDSPEICHKLFGFINIICNVMITQPAQIDEFYDDHIPDGARQAIERRDNNS